MTRISRRGALKTLSAAAAAGRVAAWPESTAAQPAPEPVTTDALLPLADVLLPEELGVDGRRAATAAFVRWIRNYKEGADTDHGYGNTRIRRTGPSPAQKYPAQMGALDDAARARGAANFAGAPLELRRAIVEAALASAKVERLPSRPTGAHIASDLMGHYFNSSAAEDLCYRAAIGRDTCRGLPGSEARPAVLKK